MEVKAATMSSGKKKLCEEPRCARERATGDFCRLHYLKNWKHVIEERRAKARDALNQYVERLSEQHPDDFMDILKSDLSDEEGFRNRLHNLGFREELEKGEDNPFEATDIDGLLGELNFEDEK